MNQPLHTPHIAKWTLVFLLIVIAWGAFVRASGSGAGCGSHWPLCNGQILPHSPSSKTLVEFIHRVTSGISLILCVILGYSSIRNYPRNSWTRKAGIASVFLVLTEALLGAGLVLLELVAQNKSLMRTISLGIHLINTFFLLAAVLLTLRWSRQETQCKLHLDSWKKAPTLFCCSIIAVFILLLVGSSGAMTALGDTLFPVTHIAQGLVEDFSSTSHFLIQLRILHPTFALLMTLYFSYFYWLIRVQVQQGNTTKETLGYATQLLCAQYGQVLLGTINILLLAPMIIQILHLLLADLIWLFLIQTLATIWVRPVRTS